MRRILSFASLPILMATLAVALGCASSRLGGLEPLPKELPPELREKFEILEATPPEEPKTSAAPSPGGAGEVRKKSVPSPKITPLKQAAAARAAGGKGKRKEQSPLIAYPNRRPEQMPIWIGERHILEINYLGMAAGEFTMEVLPPKIIAERKVYQLKATAVSSSVMNLFYRLNDVLESFWDYDGLFSHRFHMMLDQTRQQRDSLELFDSETKKSFHWDRLNHVKKGKSEKKEYFDIPRFPQDSFSAIYYLRTLPLEDGKTYSFPVVSQGKSWDAVVSVVRREIMETPLGRVRCIVVRPQTRYQGVMRQEKGPSYIWLTDDERRALVRLEAKVKVGSVTARLKRFEPGSKSE